MAPSTIQGATSPSQRKPAMKVCVPLAKGRIGHEPLAPQAAPAQGCHVGLHARLIDEDEPGRLSAHEGLTMFDP